MFDVTSSFYPDGSNYSQISWHTQHFLKKGKEIFYRFYMNVHNGQKDVPKRISGTIHHFHYILKLFLWWLYSGVQLIRENRVEAMVCCGGCDGPNNSNLSFAYPESTRKLGQKIKKRPGQKNLWNKIIQFPFFAISEMAKNQFLNWE